MTGTNWSIDGLDLQDKTRQGGKNSLKGFSFQAAFALVRLTWLLTCRNGLLSLRYEGAQDVDLRFCDGTEKYIQAKNYALGNLKLADMYDALAGFARDVISAKTAGLSGGKQLLFQFVATSIPTQDEPLQLIRRVKLAKHRSEIAKRVHKKYRRGLSDKEVLAIVDQILNETQYLVSFGDDPNKDLISLASMELVRFGVPPQDVAASIDRLLQLLEPGNSYFLEEIATKLLGLPRAHPANELSSVRLLPSKAHIRELETTKRLFFQGAPVHWDAIANGLDVHREETSKVKEQIDTLLQAGGMVVATGAAGTGKSTLIRRTAWDLHRSGSCIAMEVKFPSDVTEENWKILNYLLEEFDRPVLLIIDDVWRHPGFIEGFDRMNKPRLCLLASSRPGEDKRSDKVTFPISNVELGKVGARELTELRKIIGPSQIVQEKVVSQLLKTGQMLALSLVIQNRSIEEFAESILEPLRSGASYILDGYIDLCVGGKYDLTTPESILLKRSGTQRQLWLDPQVMGLVFKAGQLHDRVAVGHALVADAVIVASRINPVHRALEICAQCRYEDTIERRYALRLLQNYVEDKKYVGSCRAMAGQIGTEARRLAPLADYVELQRLASMLKAIADNNTANEILSKATPDTIRTGPDAALFLSTANKVNFSKIFSVLLPFYTKNSTSYARRRFITYTRNFGNPAQVTQAAALMASWLPDAGYPTGETRATFDLLAHAPQDIAKANVRLVTEYLKHGELNRDSTLAAIRLVARAKDPGVSKILFDSVIASLTHGALQGDREVAVVIAKFSVRRIQTQECRMTMFQLLENMIASTDGRRMKTSLIDSAIHFAPPNKHAQLIAVIEEVPSTKRSRRLNNALHFLQRQHSGCPLIAADA